MKFRLILICMLLVQVAFAQKGKVTTAISYFTQGRLDKAKETIDGAMKEDNLADWSKAYFIKGQIYQAIYESTNSNYKKLAPHALDTAWSAYQKSIRLDNKNKLTKELRTQYYNLEIDFLNQGTENFRAKKYREAFADFERVLQINQSPYGNQKTDTAVIFNAALSAQNSGQAEKAIEYYKHLMELNYQPARTGAMLSKLLLETAAQQNNKQAEKMEQEAVKYLERGVKQFPEDEYLLIELVNFYLQSDTPEKSEPFLDQLLRLKPAKGDYYRVQGIMFEKTHRLLRSEMAYRKALELNPEDFISQYNLGNILLSQVVTKHEALLSLQDIKEYNTGVAQILNEYEEVIPYFERAHQLKPEDKNTLSTLAQLYFRLKSKSDYDEKYEKIKELLDY